MAELSTEGDELVLHLSAAERVEGMHGDLRAPLSAIRGVEVLDVPIERLGFTPG